MNVSAIIVTRGDVHLYKVLASIPSEWEIIVWDNSFGGQIGRWRPGETLNGEHLNRDFDMYVMKTAGNLGAYGRYAAIEHAKHDLIYVQDDDCIVEPGDFDRLLAAYQPGYLVSLMPASRNDYEDTVLVGWGALFARWLPELAFERWRQSGETTESEDFRIVGADFVFPMLTPWIRLDAEHEDLPHAHAENRTWRRPRYIETKADFLRKARMLRDA